MLGEQHREAVNEVDVMGELCEEVFGGAGVLFDELGEVV
jgi:hypothetical protein